MTPLHMFFHRLTHSAWLHYGTVLFVLGLMFAFALAQGSFISWFLFYVFLPIALYITLLMFYPRQLIHPVRTFQNQQLHAGDTLKINLILSRTHAFPFILLSVTDGPDDSEESGSAKVHTGASFWSGKSVTVHYAIPEIRRGEHRFSTVQVNIEDPLGFFKRKLILPCPQSVLVFPKISQIRLNDRRMGNVDPRFTSQDIDLSQFSGIRAYQPNDRISWLDWKSTARSGRLVSKQFDRDLERHASIVLVVKDHDSGPVFERSISFTASFVKMLLSAGYTVRLACSNRQAPAYLRGDVKKGMQEAGRLLAGLTRQDALRTEDVQLAVNSKVAGFAVSTDPALAAALIEFARAKKQRQTLFLVTDRPGDTDIGRFASPYLSLFVVAHDHFDSLIQARDKNG